MQRLTLEGATGKMGPTRSHPAVTQTRPLEVEWTWGGKASWKESIITWDWRNIAGEDEELGSSQEEVRSGIRGYPDQHRATYPPEGVGFGRADPSVAQREAREAPTTPVRRGFMGISTATGAGMKLSLLEEIEPWTDGIGSGNRRTTVAFRCQPSALSTAVPSLRLRPGSALKHQPPCIPY